MLDEELETMQRETASLSQLPTSDLVEELIVHGRRLVENEVHRLKRELGTTREGLTTDGRSAVAEARERVERGVVALKADLVEQKDRATAAVKPMAIGGVLLHAGVLFLLAAVVVGLASTMALWLSALIVGVVVAGIGALVTRSGAAKAKEIGRDPLVRTNKEMTEDRVWMSERWARMVGKAKQVKSALSGVGLPRLRPS